MSFPVSGPPTTVTQTADTGISSSSQIWLQGYKQDNSPLVTAAIISMNISNVGGNWVVYTSLFATATASYTISYYSK
jgi:hypothetical protein